MTGDENTTKPSCCTPEASSKGRGLFYGSVALNLFLLGLLVGPWLGGKPMLPPPPPGSMAGPMERGPESPRAEGPRSEGPRVDRRGGEPLPGFVVDRLAHEMPKADADKLREIYADASAQLKGKREAGRESFQKIAEILKQDKPDLAALQTALDGLQAEGQGFHAEMSKALKRVATEIPLESRQKIATFIERGPQRHRMGPPDDQQARPPEEGLKGPNHGPRDHGPDGHERGEPKADHQPTGAESSAPTDEAPDAP